MSIYYFLLLFKPATAQWLHFESQIRLIIVPHWAMFSLEKMTNNLIQKSFINKKEQIRARIVKFYKNILFGPPIQF